MTQNNHTHDTGHEHDPHLLNELFMVHANRPRHMGKLPNANGYARGVGVCGDAIAVYLLIQNNIISDIRHSPRGCTYTVACGSAMSHLACGKTLEEALHIAPEDVASELDGLPEDHMHCASLAINTLGEAIDDYYQKVWGGSRPSETAVENHADVGASVE